MESNAIKEENCTSGKEISNGCGNQNLNNTPTFEKTRLKDSPEDARHQINIARASPINHQQQQSLQNEQHPLQHSTTSTSTTTTTTITNNGFSSPNGSIDSITPPLLSTSVNSDITTNQSILLNPQTSTYFGYNSSGGTKPLVKLKRFFTTLIQFSNDNSPDIGERVRNMILNLVSSNLGLEEFHHSLRDITNFPLRPFMFPFLKTHLPLLQKEIQSLARSNKQNTFQYIRSHEHVILEPLTSSGVYSSPTDLSEVFFSINNEPQTSSLSNSVFTGVKRRASDGIYESGLINGQTSEPPDYTTAPTTIITNKRPNYFLTPTNQSISSSYHFPDHPHQPQPLVQQQLPNHSPLLPSQHQPTTATAQNQQLPQQPVRTTQNYTNDGNSADEEWRNIHVMLNCILSMVEKTKRALTILQKRNNQELTNEWLRKQDISVDLRRAANEIMTHAIKQTEERVAEVRKRAEDAVNDVKRQAVIQLQKAVNVAETKANDIITAERIKMEKILSDGKRYLDESSHLSVDNFDNSASPPISHNSQFPQQNCCWNCGRKANETCSGCRIAKYCSSFCQHKDWENHNQNCTTKEKLAITTIKPTSATSTTSIISTATTISSPSMNRITTPTLCTTTVQMLTCSASDSEKFKNK